MGATLASLPTAVWAHLLSGDSNAVELPRPSSEVFHECCSPTIPQHWETHEMEYSAQYMMAAPPPHITIHGPRLSTVQWTTGDAHRSGLLYQCSDYQESVAPQQDHACVAPNGHGDYLHEVPEESRDAKRSAPGSSGDIAGLESVKKPRLEQVAACVPFKVRKEKLGERITALQQLVSPFGKTDTASVLLEAIGYIKFLQDQVQVLSTPYMKPNVVSGNIDHDEELGKLPWPSTKMEHSRQQDLRSRGLCLVPVSCTLQVANDNGADFWTPAIGGGCR